MTALSIRQPYVPVLPIAFGLTIFGILPWLLYVGWSDLMYDGHAYFAASGHLYDGRMGTPDAYLYSPAFSQLIEPLRWLGWEGFRSALRVLDIGALAIMAGPLTLPALFVQPISLEFNMGNIHLLLALAIVAGFRWPAAWAFVLLTKVTPGVGLIWFAVRREWRSLGIALGVTAGIVVVSFILAPGDWLGWLGVLGRDPALPGTSFVVITAPLLVRLPLAALLVAWGARNDYRWTVLVASFLALPSVWQHSEAMLVGLIPLLFPAMLLAVLPTLRRREPDLRAPVDRGIALVVEPYVA